MSEGIEIRNVRNCKFENCICWDGKDTPENRAMLREWLDAMNTSDRYSWLLRLEFNPYE